jgi:hypothetical protein
MLVVAVSDPSSPQASPGAWFSIYVSRYWNESQKWSTVPGIIDEVAVVSNIVVYYRSSPPLTNASAVPSCSNQDVRRALVFEVKHSLGLVWFLCAELGLGEQSNGQIESELCRKYWKSILRKALLSIERDNNAAQFIVCIEGPTVLRCMQLEGADWLTFLAASCLCMEEVLQLLLGWTDHTNKSGLRKRQPFLIHRFIPRRLGRWRILLLFADGSSDVLGVDLCWFYLLLGGAFQGLWALRRLFVTS